MALRSELAALFLLPLLAVRLAGQEREVQHHTASDPEGRLLVYYAAALAFTAIGPGRGTPPWATSVGAELSYVPQLSRAERTPGTDKPEASNLAPILPRLRFAMNAPGGLSVEAGWVPPLRVFDAHAHLFALAASRPIDVGSRTTVTPRIAAAGGWVRGAITCYDDLPDAGPDHALYYSAICNARESDDRYSPRQFSGEVIVARRSSGGVTPYLGAGVRRDDIRFDVGVKLDDGSRDTDQPILLLEATRFFATGGLKWDPGRWPPVAAELFYEPGSLLTIRLRMDLWSWRPSP